MSFLVMILAGGQGKRMRPITFAIPKPLIALNGEPILSGLIRHFSKFGVKDFVISLGYLGDLIKTFMNSYEFSDGVSIIYIEEKTPKGTAGPLNELAKLNPQVQDVLLTNGDIHTDLDVLDFYNFHKNNDYDLTVCSKLSTIQSRYGVIDFNPEDNLIRAINEKPFYEEYISCGIYLIKMKVIKLISDMDYVDMPDLINLCLNNGLKVSMYTNDFNWMAIDNIKDLEGAVIQLQESSDTK